MSSSHTLLKSIRLVHLYIGVFIAPALLFFAFTGALQIFSLHETTRGSSYKPPAWAVTLAQIHKKQTPVVPAKKMSAAEKSPDNAAPDKPQTLDPATPQPAPTPKSAGSTMPSPHNALPLKIFFLLVAIGLFTSTLSGLYLSYKYLRNRMLVSAILVVGIVVPILMTIF